MATDAPEEPEHASESPAPFPYMRWAKSMLEPNDLTLGFSGIWALSTEARAELGLGPLPEFGETEVLLKSALAERYGMGPANVHLAAGTSHANFLVFFALARGGHVAVEAPAYEALPCVARATAASIAAIQRDPERGYRIDPGSLNAALRPETALIAVTDLHNPSGKRLHEDDLSLLLEAADRTGAYLLVDEVYLDFDPIERPTAALRGDRVLTTNSLTKVHGLPDLRGGWILGSESTIRLLDTWDDLVHPAKVPAAQGEAARYVPQARSCAARTREIAARRIEQVDAWVEATRGVRWVKPDGGITGLLLLDAGVDGDAVATRAFEAYGVRAVPGSFFQVPEALRISFFLEEAHLATALARLSRAIDDVVGGAA